MWTDRSCPRPRIYGEFRQLRGWARHFEITLGVREPDVWNTSAIKDVLEEFLFWLTEDTWNLQFVYSPVRRWNDVQPPLFRQPPPSNALVVLYSGGLDSLAGIVSLARANSGTELILISATAPRLSAVLNRQIDLLKAGLYPSTIQHALLKFHLVHDLKRRREEKTQRTRGFLFFACGLAQAVAYNTNRVITCENGIGMLNLPFNKRQLGTQHTRAVHPKTFTYISRLLALLNLKNIHYDAPFMFQTKGELCIELRKAQMGTLCAQTISCDSFSLRFPPPAESPDVEWHCGKCSSCLLRRQAIFSSHMEDDDASVPYQYDVCHPGWIKEKDDPEPLLMMLDQIRLFENACNALEPKVELLTEFPELIMACNAIEQAPSTFGISKGTSVINEIIDLLRRYVSEWKYFPYYLS